MEDHQIQKEDVGRQQMIVWTALWKADFLVLNFG